MVGMKGKQVQFPVASQRDFARDAPNAAELVQQGNALLVGGRFEDAAKCFEQAIELTPTLFPAYTSLALVRFGTGQIEGAIAALTQAVEVYKEGAELLRGQADIFVNAGNSDGAIERLRVAVSMGILLSEEASRLYNHLKLTRVAEIERGDYNTDKQHGGTVGDETTILHAASELLSRIYPRERVEKALGDLAAKTARETTGRATVQPRLKWESDRTPGETPGDFIKRAYTGEIAAGTLHKGIIRSEDGKLYDALFNWLRDPAHKLEFDLPTKAEWNTRLIEERRDDPATREAVRLYTVARSRAARRAGSPTR
jgi:tetratricopeptide (TPR) repeat protein